MNKVERVLQILQGEGEGRVSEPLVFTVHRLSASSRSPLLDEMVQPSDRLCIFQVLRQTPLLPSERTRELLRKRLVLTELDEQRLVQEVLDVLVVVKRGWGGRSLVGLLLVQRLTRVDT